MRLIWGVLTALLMTEPAFAMRCDGKLIAKGDPLLKVEKLCGEPTSVQVHNIYRSGLPKSLYREPRHGTDETTTDGELLLHQQSLVEVLVEEWTYNFGPSKFMRIVRFENGVVVHVIRSGRGYVE